jgi:hypothetical protein
MIVWHIFFSYKWTMLFWGVLLFFVLTTPFYYLIGYITGLIGALTFKNSKIEELPFKTLPASQLKDKAQSAGRKAMLVVKMIKKNEEKKE